jgi:hypothetical protein
MPEPITTVGLGAIAAYLGKDGIAKLLGPTAEYLGGELQEFTKKRIDNVGRIFSNAEKKLGNEVENPGSIPPKVLKTIINEGSYSEDDIAVEYFGGVLASSRTELSRDDRGARIAKNLDNLSSYQMRAHFLFYYSLSSIFRDQGISLRTHEGRQKLEVFVPISDFATSMGFSQKEWDNPQILGHIFHGLASDNLITDGWAFGDVATLNTISKSEKITCPGIIFSPTVLGAELFLWGFGLGSKDMDTLFNTDNSFEVENTKTLSQATSTKT